MEEPAVDDTSVESMARLLSEIEAMASWEYLDDNQQVQGPHKAACILRWLAKGRMRADRRVRRCADADASSGFKPLGATEPFASLLTLVLPAPPPQSPHVAAAATDAPVWYYVDASGCEQGPFSTAHMVGWVASGGLPLTTLTRHVGDQTCAPLHIKPQLYPHGMVARAGVAADPSRAYMQYQAYAPVCTSGNGMTNPDVGRGGRQVARYVDADPWQEHMRARKSGKRQN